MSTYNLGSVAEAVLARVDNVPAGISGAQLLTIIDEERLYMEAYTGQTIGSTGIAEKFQPALVRLSIAGLLEYMELTGADTSSLSLGDFSMSKGAGSNVSSAAENFRVDGENKLRKLGRSITFNRVL